MISKEELKYFLEVAHTLNFSRAAERLGLSQPSLSAAIKRIETELGVSVFIRHKKGVTLTQAGKHLFAHARAMKEYWDTLKAKTLASHQEVEGHLVLGAHASIATEYFARFLPNLLEQYPNLHLQLKHDLSRIITEQVINLTIDIGIVVNPIQHPDLIMIKLITDHICFWRAPHIKTKNQNYHDKGSVLLCDPELLQTRWLLKKTHFDFSIQRIVSSDNLNVLANIAAHGGGIAILPQSIVQTSYSNQLEQINELPKYKDEVYLIYRNENRSIKAIQAISAAIKSIFSNSASC